MLVESLPIVLFGSSFFVVLKNYAQIRKSVRTQDVSSSADENSYFEPALVHFIKLMEVYQVLEEEKNAD